MVGMNSLPHGARPGSLWAVLRDTFISFLGPEQPETGEPWAQGTEHSGGARGWVGARGPLLSTPPTSSQFQSTQGKVWALGQALCPPLHRTVSANLHNQTTKYMFYSCCSTEKLRLRGYSDFFKVSVVKSCWLQSLRSSLAARRSHPRVI